MDAHLQNTRERVEQNGHGVERLCQIYINELKSHHAAFYEHASFADVVGLCMAHGDLERQDWNAHAALRANLIETIIEIFAPPPGGHRSRGS